MINLMGARAIRVARLIVLFGVITALTYIYFGEREKMRVRSVVAPQQVWSVKEKRIVTSREVLEVVRGAKFVLLGEKHDNLDHHRLQLFLLCEITKSGKTPALVMEQLDREYDAELSAEIARSGRTLKSVLRAGHFDHKGWKYDGYAPLVDHALRHNLAVTAGNFSRKDAWGVVNGTAHINIPAVSPAVEKLLADMIHASHPGAEIDEVLVRGMVKAQRARDFYLADALLKHSDTGAVLIAGAGHTDLRHGVPLYLSERPLVIKFTEVRPSVTDPEQYIERDATGIPQADYIWFTRQTGQK